jgi:hypothetical protein
MRIVSLAEAENRFPEAIARLREDRSFLKEGESLLDEYDVFVLYSEDEKLVFANRLDQIADEWDPVDGCWMEFLSNEEDSEQFYNKLEELL